MRSRSSGATLSGLRKALEMVMLDTPTLRATSSSVTRPVLDALGRDLVVFLFNAGLISFRGTHAGPHSSPGSRRLWLLRPAHLRSAGAQSPPAPAARRAR